MGILFIILLSFLAFIFKHTILFLLILLFNIILALIARMITTGGLYSHIIAFHVLLALFLHQHFSLHVTCSLFIQLFLEVALLYLGLEDVSDL